jgi:hypothetical protein
VFQKQLQSVRLISHTDGLVLILVFLLRKHLNRDTRNVKRKHKTASDRNRNEYGSFDC